MKVDLQLTGQDNVLEKDVSLGLQKKLTEVLKFTREKQMTNQRVTWILFFPSVRVLLKPNSV